MTLLGPALLIGLSLAFENGVSAQATASLPVALEDFVDPAENVSSDTATEPLDPVPQSQAPATGADTPPQQKENPAEPESHGTRLRWKDIPGNLLEDQVSIFTSPARINRNNLKWWVLFGGSAAALIATDQKFSDKLPQETWMSRPSNWASRLGADYVIFPLWAGFYVVGKADDNPRARDTGRLGIQALVDANITVTLLKLATQRPRPENKGDSLEFFTGGNAFPSGHSIKAWALARIVSKEFSDSRYIPILAYSVATAVGVARVGGRRHSPSDVLVGSAIGFFIGDFVYRRHHAPSESNKPFAWIRDNVRFSFAFNPR